MKATFIAIETPVNVVFNKKTNEQLYLFVRLPAHYFGQSYARV